HRERSTDSRDFGPIATSAVIGRAWLRYWPVAAFGVLPSAAHPELAPGAASGGASAAPCPPVDIGASRPRTLYCRTCDHPPRLVTRRPALGCLLEIVETLVLPLIIYSVTQALLAQSDKAHQQSMEPTLEPDQYVLVDKLTPHFDTYKRGDMVVFN